MIWREQLFQCELGSPLSLNKKGQQLKWNWRPEHKEHGEMSRVFGYKLYTFIPFFSTYLTFSSFPVLWNLAIKVAKKKLVGSRGLWPWSFFKCGRRSSQHHVFVRFKYAKYAKLGSLSKTHFRPAKQQFWNNHLFGSFFWGILFLKL